MQSAVSGAATGASTGSAFGPWGTLAGGVIGGIGGGILGRDKGIQQTDLQKKKQQLVDQLLGSLNGNGPYADLFSTDKNPFTEENFQKGYADPYLARFRNQTAPQIQQSYIANGQQRGTGLEDHLARAGVDLNQMINENYMNFVKSGLDYDQNVYNRKTNAISGILGQQDYAGREPESFGSGAMAGLGGFLSNPQFGKSIDGILDQYSKRNNKPESKGFVNEGGP